MSFNSNDKIALFIDGSNMHASVKALGFEIDYKRMLGFFDRQATLIRAFYYTALIEESDPSPIRRLVDWLDYNGYTMVTKSTKEFTDDKGVKRLKGNMDVELVIDVMEMLDYLDHIVIFSGDGDFRRLIEAAQRKGKRVTVVSTAKSTPPMVADELRRQSDFFVDLNDLKDLIGQKEGISEDIIAGISD
jgi:uncharacterized LabA/DUF88 family protein